jgi:hypothetical protein
MKHLDLQWYWLRDIIDAGTLDPSFIPTDEMAADILTKPLTWAQVQKYRDLMSLIS